MRSMRKENMVLSSEYEIAFAGLAVRHNREAEAYYWRHLIAEAKARHPDSWKEEANAFVQMPFVLIMIPERYWYWRQIGRRKIIGHEGCHGALVGAGRMPGEPLVSVYSRQRIREGPSWRRPGPVPGRPFHPRSRTKWPIFG